MEDPVARLLLICACLLLSAGHHQEAGPCLGQVSYHNDRVCSFLQGTSWKPGPRLHVAEEERAAEAAEAAPAAAAPAAATPQQ